MSGFDPGGTANNRYENLATPQTVGTFTQEWATGSVPDGYSLGAPSVYDGTVYLGEYSNNDDPQVSELAVNATTVQVTTLLNNAGSTWAPTVTGGEIIFSDAANGSLYAYELGGSPTESPLWNVADAGGGAVIQDGVLYSGGGSNFYTIDPTSGAVEWSVPVPVPLIDEPIAVDGNMAFGVGGTSLVAINLTTEQVAWTWTDPDNVSDLTRPTAADGVVIVGGDGVFAYDESTGDLLWQAPVSLGGQGLVANDVVYTYDRSGDGLEARGLQSGTVEWSGGGVPVAMAGGVIYTHDNDGLEAIDATTGDNLWSQGTEINWSREDVPAIANGVVYDPSNTLGVAAFTPSDDL
jgi:hypothetical protein